VYYVCEEVFVKRGDYYMCLKKFVAGEECVCEVFVKRGEYYLCLKEFVAGEECTMCVKKFLLREGSITCV